jgi:hypothetical protein
MCSDYFRLSQAGRRQHAPDQRAGSAMRSTLRLIDRGHEPGRDCAPRYPARRRSYLVAGYGSLLDLGGVGVQPSEQPPARADRRRCRAR